MSVNRIFIQIQLLLVILCCFATESVYGQNKTQDVVYLENGSIYRGDIIENHSDSTVAIMIYGGSIIVLPLKSILSIGKEPAFDPFDVVYAAREPGYTNFTSIGSLFGGNNYAFDIGVFIDMVNGYHWNERFQTGIGTMLEASQNFFLTVYGDARFNFLKGKNTPFLFGDIGFHTPVVSTKNNSWILDTDPGLSVGYGVGLRSNSKRSQAAFIMSLGYKMSKYSVTELNFWDLNPVTYKYTEHRVVLRIGIAI